MSQAPKLQSFPLLRSVSTPASQDETASSDDNDTPFELYTYATPNGRKASIMLEEVGRPYNVRVVDIERGDQKLPQFVSLNPNGKIPVLVDPRRNRTVFESCAILLYLADTTGVLRPTDEERYQTYQWLFFQAGHVGPMLGQLWHFGVFAKEILPYAINRYQEEANRLFAVLNTRLEGRDFLVGRYGIADIANWTWVDAGVSELRVPIAPYPQLARWHAAVAARPAVQRGAVIPSVSVS